MRRTMSVFVDDAVATYDPESSYMEIQNRFGSPSVWCAGATAEDPIAGAAELSRSPTIPERDRIAAMAALIGLAEAIRLARQGEKGD
jgi:hypothetical protein